MPLLESTRASASTRLPSPACSCLTASAWTPFSDADELQLFLEHVYFPCSYPYPPFVPDIRVDLSTIERDAVLPLFPMPDAAAVAQYVRRDAQDKCQYSPGLLSLIHYFHAERLWQQSVAVITAKSRDPVDAWYWLSILARYGLKEEEDRLIQAAALDQGVCDNKLCRRRTASLPPFLMLRFMQAIYPRKKQ